jgi:hypothetical protein
MSPDVAPASQRKQLRQIAVMLLLLFVVAAIYAEQRFHLIAHFDPQRPLQSLVDGVRHGDNDPRAAIDSDAPSQSAPAAKLSLDATLFHSILIGKAYGIAIIDANLLADAAPTSITRELAAAAVTATYVAAQDAICCELRSSKDYIESRLREATRIERVALASDVPPLNNDDMVLLHAYAMVLGGKTSEAIPVLAASIGRDSEFAQSVAVVALRAMGSAEARSAIRAAKSSFETVKALIDDAHGIERPNFAEPKLYESEMPRAIRTRDRILAQAADDKNGTRTIQPTLLLGYLGSDAPSQVREAELEYLRSIPARSNAMLWYRDWYGAMSLALRSKETYRFWKTRLLAERAPYTQMGLIRVLAQHYPKEFLRDAPEFAASPLLVAWGRTDAIAMSAAIARGDQPLGSLDLIWFHPKRYRMKYPAFAESLPTGDPDSVLRRFAKGDFPPDPSCSGCMLSWFDTMRRTENDKLFALGLLRGRAAGDAYTRWATNFSDVRVLPALAVLSRSYPAGSRPQDDIEQAIIELEKSDDGSNGVCCADTDACLASQARLYQMQPTQVTTIDEAIAYLEQLPPIPKVSIERDRTKAAAGERAANVTLGSATPSRWTHWLGCWRPDNEKK